MDDHADPVEFEGGQGADALDWARADRQPLLRSITTPLPTHPRLRFGRYDGAAPTAGCDYADVLNLGGNRFAVTLADIAGPGAPGAAAMIAAAVRGRAGRHDDSGSLLHHMSERVRHVSNGSLSATGLCAVIDTRRRTVRIACAGHSAPLLAREGASISPLLVHNAKPLGNTELIVTCEYEMQRSDRLLFYTDRVIRPDDTCGLPSDYQTLLVAEFV